MYEIVQSLLPFFGGVFTVYVIQWIFDSDKNYLNSEQDDDLENAAISSEKNTRKLKKLTIQLANVENLLLLNLENLENLDENKTEENKTSEPYLDNLFSDTKTKIEEEKKVIPSLIEKKSIDSAKKKVEEWKSKQKPVDGTGIGNYMTYDTGDGPYLSMGGLEQQRKKWMLTPQENEHISNFWGRSILGKSFEQALILTQQRGFLLTKGPSSLAKYDEHPLLIIVVTVDEIVTDLFIQKFDGTSGRYD